MANKGVLPHPVPPCGLSRSVGRSVVDGSATAENGVQFNSFDMLEGG